ncbi:hypothetical protein [Dyella sp. 2RAB6]|uniref:hypothetical protein n=1 Tax=Dyella sp. 2RAB6 TaxID=3232992 RepID=UPI003F8F872B
MQVQVHVAGMPRELERRISLACRLLAADQLEAEMQPWRGHACDVLVVDMQNGYGRLAYEVARRKSFRVLSFGTRETEGTAPGVAALDYQASVVVIAKALRNALLPLASTEPATATGLLDVCVGETGRSKDFLAKSGQVAVIIRLQASRIHARTVSDLLAAEARLLNPGWSSANSLESAREDESWHVSRSLDSFFVAACRRFQNQLPVLDHRAFKLRRWPDLGGIPDDVSALRLAALLNRSAWTVRGLAQHANIEVAGVNAFCWATLAGGALSSDELTTPDSNSCLTGQSSTSIFQRVARHFGMRFGHGHMRA